jgi:hypothetical protein
VALRPTQGYMPGMAQGLGRLLPARTRGADNEQHASGPIQSPCNIAKESIAMLKRTHHCPDWPGAAQCAQQRTDQEALLSTSTADSPQHCWAGHAVGKQR